MLRNVCDNCGAVIDGEPQSKEYPEAILLIDDDVAVMYENLCTRCRSNLIAAVKRFDSEPLEPIKPIETREQPRKQEPKHNPTEQNNAESGHNQETGHVSDMEVPVIADKENTPLNHDTVNKQAEVERPLANQVVKQYPINLSKRD